MNPNDEDMFQSLKNENEVLKSKLLSSEKARKRVEMFKEQNQIVLENVNSDLNSTLKKLQSTQLQLIQSEKMASLGQLIAGISHEINTPAAAILGAVGEINKDYQILLTKLVLILEQLPEGLRANFLKICNQVTNLIGGKGTAEERVLSKDLESSLKENQIFLSRTAVSNLAKVGINNQNLPDIIPLLKTDLSEDIQNTLFMLGMSKLHLRDIQIGIQKIVSLVKALKLYSRSEHDEIGSTKLEEDILITLTILHNRLKHGITVIKEFEHVPEIRCYADQLNQVWTNLINNSIEAMKGKGQIILRLKNSGENYIQVEVEDNGPGIPEGIRHRIFEPYFTTKPKGEGTGLGLSITKEIIDKHHGTILVESVPGKTIFKVRLPRDISKQSESIP